MDETGGNEYFAQQGATLIARDEVRNSMLHPKVPDAALPERQARQVRAASKASVPTLTFATEMTLYLYGQEIRLIPVPRAHTDGDALIWVPGLNVLVVGDVLRAHEFPSIGRPDGGTLPGMLDALTTVIGTAVRDAYAELKSP